MRVVVIGAGVIGAAAAEALARRGAEVTVLDRGDIASGCSYGNAGWLTPCFATPLPAPGVLTKSLGWLLDPESPLHVHPSLRWEWVRWITRFAASTTERKFRAGTDALTALSTSSLAAWTKLESESPGSFGFVQRGLLLVAQSEPGLRDSAAEAAEMKRHGISSKVLSPAEVRELEPAVVGRVTGGVYFEKEAHCEPADAVRALLRSAEAAGAKVRTGVEVYGFETRGGKIGSLRTTKGDVEAERFVLAAGTWSKELGRRLGLRVPLLGGKGYALIVSRFEPAPTRPIKIIEKKIAVTPRSTSVRIAGTLELVDGDERISPRRVDVIVRGARSVLPVPDPPEVLELWRGLRPCTPDGLPIIGRSPLLENLVICTGHQMCGLHTAPASGQLAADIALDLPPTFDPTPFRADRF